MLTLADREEISRGLAESSKYGKIAVRIGRDASVVSREVGRHGGREVYRAIVAEQAAGVARSRPLAVDRDPAVRARVVGLLRGAGRRRRSRAGRHGARTARTLCG
ncbi:hypothetical protein EKG83_32900 [Saccharothrix syringae]|uniref:Transposase IS30-like HTH domain-containing protein n=1 Tax=Saccharothrix syringae TaxID=103733 RepID=A0A5Q0H6I9_SACSY|nr:hypothetical protein EKG83_32900 [Saccharothrix syringae]